MASLCVNTPSTHGQGKQEGTAVAQAATAHSRNMSIR